MSSESFAKRISIENKQEISAIYFALLQNGYDFYAMDKDSELIKSLDDFLVAKDSSQFFADVKQNTCEVYPYWPRAAILEVASFYFDSDLSQFNNFNEFKNNIMSARNISDDDRGREFWEWVKDFPGALNKVIRSSSFQSYLQWENEWINQQNLIHIDELQNIQMCLDICIKLYASPIQKITVILNPIKCAYSADYHMIGEHFLFCSGAFKPESVIHEFLHHVVHPVVKAHKEEILSHNAIYPDIDQSYYLTGDEIGLLNAFEEYFVRLLTDVVLAENPPDNIDELLIEILNRLD